MEYLRSFVIHSKASVLIGDKKNWTPLIILPFIRKYSSHPFVPLSPLSTSCRHEEAKMYEDAKKGASSRPPAASQYFMQLASSPR